MLMAAIVFMLISITAGSLGIERVERTSATISKLLFGIAAVLLVIAMVLFVALVVT